MKVGVGELLIVLLIILVLFGAKRLPEIGQAIGKALKEFKKATKEIEDDSQDKPQKNG